MAEARKPTAKQRKALASLVDELRPLLEIPAVSGGEARFGARFAELLRETGAEVFVDAIGNVVARKGKAPSRALVCHLDNVGWMVERAAEDGAFPLVPVGGVTPSVQQRAVLTTGDGSELLGLVVTEKGGERPVFELLDRARASEVGAGDRVSYAATYDLDGACLQGPYLDNRLGCWMVLDALRKAKSLLVIATVCEETTCMGAYQSRHWLDGIEDVVVVDVTYASAYGMAEYPIEVGGGPVLSLKDSLMPPQVAVDELKAAAEAARVELQFEVCDVGASDAMVYTQWDRPIRWVFVGVPSRYNHQASEVVDLRDVLATGKVLDAWVKRGASTKRRSRRRKS